VCVALSCAVLYYAVVGCAVFSIRHVTRKAYSVVTASAPRAQGGHHVSRMGPEEAPKHHCRLMNMISQ
jgi:hypothetical protein